MEKKSYFGFFTLLFVGVVASFVGFLFSSPLVSHLTHHAQTVPVIDTVIQKIDHTTLNTFTISQKQSLVPNAYAQDIPSDYEQAQEYIVLNNQTGNVLFEKNSQYPVSIASLTKIMTAVVALDLTKPSDQLTISQAAGSEIPTTIGVVPGQQMTVDELLHGMLMTSANDAAQAVKDGINAKYGSQIFIAAMNEKAKMLGLTNTHFANPQGFDNSQNYSSAHDLAILTHYALTNYPEIASIVDQGFMHIDANNFHKQFDLNNWNGLLDVYPGAYGVKIGNTGGAGYTTIVASKRNGTDLLAVVLDAPGIVERDLWTAQLLDKGFEQYNLSPANITKAQLLAKYATWKYYN